MLTVQAEAARQEAHAQKALSRTLQEQQRLADDEALQQVCSTRLVTLSLNSDKVAIHRTNRAGTALQ